MVDEEIEEVLEDHEGVLTKQKKGTSLKTTEFDFFKAINSETDPRKIFLIGQLYLEFECDAIISIYFQTTDGLRNGVLSDFLKFESISFSTKIKMLKYLAISGKDAKPINLIDSKIIKGLGAISQIRNAFQHNLTYEEALKSALKEGANFGLINKNISDCKDINSLVKCFKNECENIYLELNKIIMHPELDNSKVIMDILKKKSEEEKIKNDISKSSAK